MSLVTIAAILIVLASGVTAIPFPTAKKASHLGYRALCPFAPISTIFLLLVAGIVWLIGNLA